MFYGGMKMRYAVIAKLFPDGRITHKIQSKFEYAEDKEFDTDFYHCIVDVFDSYEEARKFDCGYRRY